MSSCSDGHFLSCCSSFKNLHSLCAVCKDKFRYLSSAFKVSTISSHPTNPTLSVPQPQNLPSTLAKLMSPQLPAPAMCHAPSYVQACAHAVSLDFEDISLSFANEILSPWEPVVPKLCCILGSCGDLYRLLMPGSHP